MKASVEISYYPLQEDYKKIIVNFINKLKTRDDISIEVNGFSTQLFGDYDVLMKVLTEEMKVQAADRRGMFVLKITGSDLQGPVDLEM